MSYTKQASCRGGGGHRPARRRCDRADGATCSRAFASAQGRLFFLGVGGSAGNCSHAVNDFRKIAGIEAYAPTDNVSELTARTNDEGWETVFVEWLKTSRLSANDMLFVFSVGGGNLEKNVSPNLVRALQYAQTVGAQVVGVVGRDGGYTAKVADACVIVPTVNPDTVTPHAEAFQAVVWHLLVSHPALKVSDRPNGSPHRLKRAVFLDRDGVINRAVVRDGKPYPPRSLGEVEVVARRADALRAPARSRLRADRRHEPAGRCARHAGRGVPSRRSTTGLRPSCRSTTSWSAITTTPTGCACRKPKPGGLLEAAARHQVDLRSSFMVGDRWRDIEAGQRAGCTTFFIDYGYAERQPAPPFLRVRSLAEAAETIVTDITTEA